MVMFGSARLALSDFGNQFRVEFDRQLTEASIKDLLANDYIAVRGASIEAVVDTTNEVKERLRDYLDSYFTRSEVIGGGGGRKARRRASFASTQSKFYNDIAEKGQYTGLIYSKFGRGKGPGNFVDFLMLHLRGGSVRPRRGDWIKIRNTAVTGGLREGGQVGDYPFSNSRIFFKKAPGGRKMYLLRETFGFGRGRRKEDRKVELLATLVKGLTFAPRLTGLDVIAASRIDLFNGKFRAALEARIGSE